MPRRKKKNLNSTSHLYLMMNKPCGYVCSSASDRSPLVFDLVPEKYKSYCSQNELNLHTVGRLDKETSGLLILTTDGLFSHNLTSPENHVKKIYEAVLKESESLERQKEISESFARGILMPEEKKAPEQMALPAESEWLSEKVCRVTVMEGKFHQIRRMFLAVGNEVVELKRISLASFKLSDDFVEGAVKDFCPKDYSFNC
ncbi:MAG: rRNA pseudouridine synthase [Treponema sp.]|nr:rRNA pseudouridine synthase [Treponema sp.]